MMSDIKKSVPFVFWADCEDPDQSSMCWHKEDALTQVNDHGGTLYELSHTSELDAALAREQALQQRLNAADQRIDEMTSERESLIAYGRNNGLDEAATLCTRMAHDAYFPPGTRFKHFTPKAQEQRGNLLIKAANAIADLPDGPYARHCARQQQKAAKSATA